MGQIGVSLLTVGNEVFSRAGGVTLICLEGKCCLKGGTHVGGFDLRMVSPMELAGAPPDIWGIIW